MDMKRSVLDKISMGKGIDILVSRLVINECVILSCYETSEKLNKYLWNNFICVRLKIDGIHNHKKRMLTTYYTGCLTHGGAFVAC